MPDKKADEERPAAKAEPKAAQKDAAEPQDEPVEAPPQDPPADIAPSAPFDPAAPHFKSPTGQGAPAPVDGEGTVSVLYRGPSDEFVAQQGAQRYVMERNLPLSLPPSLLAWLRTANPGHSWEQAG